MQVVAYLLCGGLAVGVVTCLRRPSPLAAAVLLVVAALWEPANNNYLEGPVLWTVTRDHGLTLADLYGALGFGVAALTLIRTAGTRASALPRLAAFSTIFACGALATLVVH